MRNAVSAIVLVFSSLVAMVEASPQTLPSPPPSAAADLPAAPLPTTNLAQPLPPAAPTLPKASAIKPVVPPAAPQPIVQQTASFATLNAPGLAALIQSAKLGEIPDDNRTRRFVFSVYKGMGQSCGEHGQSMALTAASYVEPRMAPGRDIAQLGMDVFLQQLQGIAKISQSGDIRDVVDFANSNSYEYEEGTSDGMAIASALGCGSAAYRQFETSIEALIRQRSGTDQKPDELVAFSALMSKAAREKAGFPDPELELRKRRIRESSNNAKTLCAREYKPTGFCDCLIGRISALGIDESSWKAIGTNFSSIITVAVHQPKIAESIRACVRS